MSKLKSGKTGVFFAFQWQQNKPIQTKFDTQVYATFGNSFCERNFAAIGKGESCTNRSLRNFKIVSKYAWLNINIYVHRSRQKWPWSAVEATPNLKILSIAVGFPPLNDSRMNGSRRNLACLCRIRVCPCVPYDQARRRAIAAMTNNADCIGYWTGYSDERVCLCVCLQAYLRNCTHNLYQILCARYVWPWLDPPLVVLRYAMYFRFVSQFTEFRHSLSARWRVTLRLSEHSRELAREACLRQLCRVDGDWPAIPL